MGGSKGGSSKPAAAAFKGAQQRPQQRPQQRQQSKPKSKSAPSRQPAKAAPIILMQPTPIIRNTNTAIGGGLGSTPPPKKKTSAPKTNFTGADGKKRLVGSGGGSTARSLIAGEEIDTLGY